MNAYKEQNEKPGINLMKRNVLVWLGLMPIVGGCKAAESSVGMDITRKFRGINGVVLVVDAVEGMDKENVDLQSEAGLQLFRSSLVAKRVRKVMAFGGNSFSIPKTVRVRARKGDNLYNYREQHYENGIVTDDYTIDVASRIPDDVLDSIRKNGGALRLKFRLKDDGVLFGWDIERSDGRYLKLDMPGGDFMETKY